MAPLAAVGSQSRARVSRLFVCRQPIACARLRLVFPPSAHSGFISAPTTEAVGRTFGGELLHREVGDDAGKPFVLQLGVSRNSVQLSIVVCFHCYFIGQLYRGVIWGACDLKRVAQG